MVERGLILEPHQVDYHSNKNARIAITHKSPFADPIIVATVSLLAITLCLGFLFVVINLSVVLLKHAVTTHPVSQPDFYSQLKDLMHDNHESKFLIFQKSD